MWSLDFRIEHSMFLGASGAKTTQTLTPKDGLSGHSLLQEPRRLAVFREVTQVACRGQYFKWKAPATAKWSCWSLGMAEPQEEKLSNS